MFRKNLLIQNLLSDLGALQKIRLAKALFISFKNWNNPTVFRRKSNFIDLNISSIELQRLKCALAIAKSL